MEILAKLTIPEHDCIVTIYNNATYRGTGILRRGYYSYSMHIGLTELFSGDDYSPSPMIASDSLESLVELLSFLTTRPGDTDDEYFNGYTQQQLDFANSLKCEELQSIPYDCESDELDTYFNVNSDDSLPFENFVLTYK
jgi:hypothetical protein